MFAGLNQVENGYLLRALGYFHHADDARALCAARSLGKRVETFEEKVCALWGWRAFVKDADIFNIAQENVERVLEMFATAQENVTANVPHTFPQFDPRDSLFLLRVLAEYERVDDPRVKPLIDALVAKQNERAQWTLERDLNAQLVTPLEHAGEASRWITLNAVHILVKLVMRET